MSAAVLARLVETGRLHQARLGRVWLGAVPLSFVASYAFMVVVLSGKDGSLVNLVVTVAIGFGLFQPFRIAMGLSSQGVNPVRAEVAVLDLPGWFPGILSQARAIVRGGAYPIIALAAVVWSQGVRQGVIFSLLVLGYLAWMGLVTTIVAVVSRLVADVREVVPLVTRAALVLSPVLYQPEQLADRLGGLADVLRLFNPLFPWLELAHGIGRGVAPRAVTLAIMLGQTLFLGLLAWLFSRRRLVEAA